MLLASGCASLRAPRGDRACGAACLELDHIFVFVSKDAPEREVLIALGLQAPDRVSRHTGQGTASVSFVFENAYLELLWVADEDELAATCAAGDDDFCRRAKWRQTQAWPFGIGLRNSCGRDHPPPLKHRELRGEWMKPDSCLYLIEDDGGVHEPEYFVVPPYMAVPAWVEKADTTHPLGVRRLTRAEVTVGPKAGAHGVSDFGVGSGFGFVSASPSKRLSPAARLLQRSAGIRFHRGASPLLTLTFDDARQRKTADLRPDLPIIIRY
jgi:hypothetical protein